MLDIAKHKLMLVQVLKDIYSDVDIASSLGFKGGTALYLFYDLPRFSVDLDLNLLNAGDKESVFKKIGDICGRHGTIKDQAMKLHTMLYEVSYGASDRNMKIEISERKFPDSYELKQYFGIPVQVMKKPDMLAHKMAALLDRKRLAVRDVFDIWFLMKERAPVAKSVFDARVKEEWRAYLTRCRAVIEEIDNRYILQGLGELLDDTMKTWAKNNLKKEALFLIDFYRDNPIVV